MIEKEKRINDSENLIPSDTLLVVSESEEYKNSIEKYLPYKKFLDHYKGKYFWFN